MIGPKTGFNDVLPYTPGFSIEQPFTTTTPFEFGIGNGIMKFTPTQSEISVIAIMINEYRNGILIGQVERDFIFFSRECIDKPVLSGINNTSEFMIDACPGAAVCFDVYLSSILAEDSVSISWENGIPASTFTTNPGQFTNGEFCWMPSFTDPAMQYCFEITVNTSRCSYIATSSAQYCINLLDAQTCLLSTNSIEKNKVKIYSSPSSGNIIINMDDSFNASDNMTVYVMNVSGQKIITMPLKEKYTSLESRELKNEKVLFVRILDKNGNEKHNEKIVRVN
jgi:hypothetical protein